MPWIWNGKVGVCSQIPVHFGESGVTPYIPQTQGLEQLQIRAASWNSTFLSERGLRTPFSHHILQGLSKTQWVNPKFKKGISKTDQTNLWASPQDPQELLGKWVCFLGVIPANLPHKDGYIFELETLNFMPAIYSPQKDLQSIFWNFTVWSISGEIDSINQHLPKHV